MAKILFERYTDKSVFDANFMREFENNKQADLSLLDCENKILMPYKKHIKLQNSALEKHVFEDYFENKTEKEFHEHLNELAPGCYFFKNSKRSLMSSMLDLGYLKDMNMSIEILSEPLWIYHVYVYSVTQSQSTRLATVQRSYFLLTDAEYEFDDELESELTESVLEDVRRKLLQPRRVNKIAFNVSN